MQYGLKHDRSSTDSNAEWKKVEALDCKVSYIIEHDEFNLGSAYVVKDINQKYIEYLCELGILEQPPDTKTLLHALTNLCSKIINKKSVALFSDTISTLVKKYIESPNDFFYCITKDCTFYTKRTF